MSLAIDLSPTGLESILLEVAVIAGLLVSIVLGIRALRNRR
ncbi:MAG TPA: hypothetical protein VFG13_15015 [Blastococcus sp.]|nr:hypothetical protein [Blastococcus sp.]